MERLLTYDMMLEVEAVFRSQDVRVTLHREVEPGETISVHGWDWLVTDVVVAKPNHGLDRRLVAQEIVKAPHDGGPHLRVGRARAGRACFPDRLRPLTPHRVGYEYIIRTPVRASGEYRIRAGERQANQRPST